MLLRVCYLCFFALFSPFPQSMLLAVFGKFFLWSSVFFILPSPSQLLEVVVVVVVPCMSFAFIAELCLFSLFTHLHHDDCVYCV